jgi:hypothetical protein
VAEVGYHALQIVKLVVSGGVLVASQCAVEVRQRMHDLVAMRDGGVGDVLVLELHRVAEALAVGVLDVAAMCSIVLGGRGQIPAVHGVEGPRASLVGLLVDLHFASQWRERHLVVIEGPAHVRVG